MTTMERDARWEEVAGRVAFDPEHWVYPEAEEGETEDPEPFLMPDRWAVYVEVRFPDGWAGYTQMIPAVLYDHPDAFRFMLDRLVEALDRALDREGVRR